MAKPTKPTAKRKTISKNTKLEIIYAMEMFKRLFMLEDALTFHGLVIKYKSNPEELSTDEHYFVKTVLEYLAKQGVSVEDVLQNKDLFMTFEMKQNEGSFFTPLRWAREAHKLVIDTVGLEDLKDYHVWDSSCGSGNLLIEFPECKHLWLSTLNSEDIPIVENRLSTTRHKDNFTAFQLDFLSAVDSPFYEGFTSLLPKGLQEALRNNEKIAIIINPPYSVRGTDTYLGQYLQKSGLVDFKTDLYRQFVWQFVNLVKHHSLTNVEFVLMVAASINISKRSQSTIELLDDTFNYRNGFIYPAREFEGVSDGFEWGISTTHWGIKDGEVKKSTDALTLMSKRSIKDLEDVIDYDGKILRQDKVIENTGETIFTKEVQKSVWNWLWNGRVSKRDTNFVKISSYGDSIVNDKEILKASSNAFFYVYGRDTLRDVSNYLTFQTTPVNTGDLEVTEDNLDRAVWFMCYGLRTKVWEERSYQRFLPPVLDDYFYNEYLPNAYLLAFMSRVNLTYAVRDLITMDGKLTYNNATFPLTKKEVEDAITDPHLMEDFKKNYKEFTYIQDKIKWAYENSCLELKEAWDIYTGIYKKYLSEREVIENEPLTCAYDLTFGQIRRLKNYSKKVDEEAYQVAFERAWEKMKEYNLGLHFDYSNPNAAD